MSETDLVAALRGEPYELHQGQYYVLLEIDEAEKAADLIEGLEAEVKRLREVLRSFVDLIGQTITFEGVLHYIINTYDFDDLKERIATEALSIDGEGDA